MFHSEIEQEKQDNLRRDEIIYHVMYKILLTTPISIKCRKSIVRKLPITHWFNTIDDYEDVFYINVRNERCASLRVFRAIIVQPKSGKEVEVYFSIPELMNLIDKSQIQTNPEWIE